LLNAIIINYININKENKMSVELKVKSKHLSEEARIIRFEERKQLKQYQWAQDQYRATGNNDMYPRWDDKAFNAYHSLKHHRQWDVRNENRATFLARAFIAGVPYETVEQKRKPENESYFQILILPRVWTMVAKYGNRVNSDSIWDREKNRYEATAVLKQKIQQWTTLDV
jgi:hypothetical protein